MTEPAPPDALDLAEVSGGTRLRLRVQPRARRNAILGVHAGALKVAVTAPPDKGKANRAVVELLAATLGLPTGAVELIAGQAARVKTVVVPLSPVALTDRLFR